MSGWLRDIQSLCMNFMKLHYTPEEEPAALRRPIKIDEWNEIRRTLSLLVKGLDDSDRKLAERIALSIANIFSELDLIMDLLCTRTCHYCSNICCHAKVVFYTEVDLLFLTVYGKFYPSSQTRLSPEQEFCSYWKRAQGCILPRLFRPYICTWFICDRQTDLLREILSAKAERRLGELYKAMRHYRLLLSSLIFRSTSKNI